MSSLAKMKEAYPGELELKMYPPTEDVILHKERPLRKEDELLLPYEKLERSRQYSKRLYERKEEKRQREENARIKQKRFDVNFSLRIKRMEKLFAIYAAQTSDSYRKAARRRPYLPQLNCAMKAFNVWKRHQLDKDDEEKHFLPKIPNRTTERSS